MKSLLRTPVLTLAISVLVLSQHSLVYAEGKQVEVKTGNTLSTILAEHYPSYKNNKTFMQAILEANPDGFQDKNIHRLIVGKTLKLPDPNSIPNLQAAEQKPVTATAASATQTPTANQDLVELKKQLKALEADKAQLTQQLEQLTTESKAKTETVATVSVEELTQQLNEIESANQQILAEKNKLTKEQEDLKQQLKTLDADKKQLEAKLAESSKTVTPEPAASTTADGPDAEALMQQLDEIESANQQIIADKKNLEKERDELKQQLQTLQAEKNQTKAPTEVATGESPTATPNEDTIDTAFLTQQLDEIESANQQLLTDKTKLESDLKTAQQQLQERETTMSALTGQLSETKKQLENTQKDLQLANAARANAELTKASLEKERGSWWSWLLAFLMLPLGWFLGRRSKTVTPEPANAAAPSVNATNTNSTEIPRTEELSPALAPIANELAPATLSSSTVAANDDNVDAAIKLDMVRAYLDLRDSTAASALLKEVLREGGRQQQQEAKEILSFLG